jgi:prepilin peptidase CpaA
MTIADSAATVAAIFFPAMMIFAGIMDLMTLKIRNVLVLAIALGFFILAPLAGFSLEEIGWSVAVAAMVFAFTFVFFALGWIGGGDAKLAFATALWFGPQFVLPYFTLTMILGGVLTLIIIVLRRSLLPAPVLRVQWVAQLCDSKSGVPYGAAMAPAALIIFPETEWVNQLLS